jgi:hypothetical protein
MSTDLPRAVREPIDLRQLHSPDRADRTTAGTR